jgi:putative FmdB family regulatory protein
MPLYEYQCDACAHRFEVIQKFSDPPIEVCPKCGGTVGKLLSSPAIQFKGSGWYITDYARAGKNDGPSSTKTEGEAKAGPESKGESKPDAKGDAKATSSETKSSETKSESKSSEAPPR